jgi:soluble lytic murein transglycosylase-like protein
MGSGDRGPGTGDRGIPLLPLRRSAAVLLVAIALILAASREAEAQYLAVFTDGRVLAVTGARLVEGERIRLELKSGGVLVAPLSRLESVIEDAVEPAPEPVPPPPCPPAFADQALPEATPYRGEIVAASRKADLHPWLVAAVVEAESRYNRWAVSRVGARGLMQLMPSVWIEGGIADPHDVRANLRVGCAHLRALITRYRELPLALAAYNAGPAVVDRSGGMPPYRETREFVRRVLSSFCPAPG